MSILTLILLLVVLGLVLYVVSRLPLDPNIKKIIQAIVVFVVVLWLLQAFFGPFGDIGRIRIR